MAPALAVTVSGCRAPVADASVWTPRSSAVTSGSTSSVHTIAARWLPSRL
jgi:hypothetical protein